MKHGITWGEDLGQLAEFYSSKRAVGEISVTEGSASPLCPLF